MELEYLAEGSPACPLIRLYEFNDEEVLKLRELVRSLVTGVGQSVALQDEAWVEPVAGCCLSLHRGDRDQGVRKVASLNFECVLSSEGWSDVEGLLDPFCGSNTAGFQWLTYDGTVALLISQNGQW